MTDHPLSEEPFPNVQPELPLVQLRAISSCPIAAHQSEISTSSSTARLEEVVDCNEVTPQPSLLQAEQTKGPHLLLLSLALETLHYLGHPALDTLQ